MVKNREDRTKRTSRQKVDDKQVAFTDVMADLWSYPSIWEAEVAFKLYFKKEQTSKDWKVEAKETIT